MGVESKQGGTGASFVIPVIAGGPSLSNKFYTAIGYMPAGCLLPGGYDVPEYQGQDQGYQRTVGMTRVKSLAASLRTKSVEIPTSVLLSLRVENSESYVKGGNLHLGRLYGRHVKPFSVVDGQHRLKALEKLVQDEEEKVREYWKKFLIPFVCLVGASEIEEMRQFYLVNRYAKSVPVGLAHQLLLKQEKGGVLSREELNIKEAEIRATELANLLNEKSKVWQGLIQMPNEEKGKTLLTLAAMVRSLKDLVLGKVSEQRNLFFERKTLRSKLVLLDAYWQGIQLVVPEVFESPQQYSLQKGTGVWAMHSFLHVVLLLASDKNKDLEDPKTYAEIVSNPLLKLRGISEDGQELVGPDFWLTGGAISGYAGAGGKQKLVGMLNANRLD